MGGNVPPMYKVICYSNKFQYLCAAIPWWGGLRRADSRSSTQFLLYIQTGGMALHRSPVFVNVGQMAMRRILAAAPHFPRRWATIHKRTQSFNVGALCAHTNESSRMVAKLAQAQTPQTLTNVCMVQHIEPIKFLQHFILGIIRAYPVAVQNPLQIAALNAAILNGMQKHNACVLV